MYGILLNSVEPDDEVSCGHCEELMKFCLTFPG